MPDIPTKAIIDGKTTTVLLPEGRSRWVKEKGKAITEGNYISDAEAYRRAYNKPHKSAEQLGNGTNAVVKDCRVQGALEVYKQAIRDKITPEKQAEKLNQHLNEVDANRAAPLWDVLYKVTGGHYDAGGPQQQGNQVNFNLNVKSDNIF